LSLQKKGLAISCLSDYYLRESRIILFSIFNFMAIFAVSFFPAFKSIFVKAGEKISCRFALPKGDKT